VDPAGVGANQKTDPRGQSNAATAAQQTAPLDNPAASGDRRVVQLPFEGQILRGGGVNLDVVTQMQQSPAAFKNAVETLREQMEGNQLASDMGNLYRSAIARQLESISKNSHVASFACGLKTCIGSVDGLSDQQLSAWQAAFNKDRTTPSYAFVGIPADPANGDTSFKFIFSTDQSAGSVSATPLTGR
jgi:hypothetical protein